MKYINYMRTVLNFSNKKELFLLEEFQDDDNRFSESFVRYFIEAFTKEESIIFDPFAGYGTSLRVAESLGRIGYGTEYDQKKAVYAKTTLKHPEHLINEDALNLSALKIPDFDLSITSPLYMHRDDENPFKTKTVNPSDYEQYLCDIETVYSQLKNKLKPGGKVIIEVSNLKKENAVTTLAWDIAKAVSKVLHFEGETIIHWEEGYGYGYDHSYALIFRK